MNGSNEIIRPFKSMRDYLCALHVIHDTFNLKTKNYMEVMTKINKFVLFEPESSEARSFIDKVLVYPKDFGLDYFDNVNKFRLELREYSVKDSGTTLVLTPNLKQCFICQSKVPLTIKRQPFDKEPILYAENAIGKLKFIPVY